MIDNATLASLTNITTNDANITTDGLFKNIKSTNKFHAGLNALDTLHNYTACLKHHIHKNIDGLIEYTFPEMEKEFKKICFKELFGHEDGKICKWPSDKLVGPLSVNPIHTGVFLQLKYRGVLL